VSASSVKPFFEAVSVEPRSDGFGNHKLFLQRRAVKMKRYGAKIAGVAAAVWLLAKGLAVAAGGGPVAQMVIVADTRKLTGLMAWWSNLYNESSVQFTILTVVLIPIIGVAFGVIADIIMTHIGIDLKSRELAEH
jgi:hypothetical protein